MIYKAITTGQVGTTADLSCPSGLFAVSLVSDVTNSCNVIVRKDSGSGAVVFDADAKQSVWYAGPFHADGATTLHLTVAGTNGTAQLFEVID